MSTRLDELGRMRTRLRSLANDLDDLGGEFLLRDQLYDVLGDKDPRSPGEYGEQRIVGEEDDCN